MKALYASPLRVYLLMALVAGLGLYSGTKLPISLFPNSSRPEFYVNASYGPLTPDEYMHSYGLEFEGVLRKIHASDAEVEKIDATYSFSNNARYVVTFRWGDNQDSAQKEINAVVAQMAARIGNNRDYPIYSWLNHEHSGFLALSFYSKERSPSEIFKIIDPIISPKIKSVPDAENPSLWNPEAQDVTVQLKPEALTGGLQITVQMVEQAIRHAFETREAGQIRQGDKTLRMLMPRRVNSVQDLGQVTVITNSQRIVPLKDIAVITLGPNSDSDRIYKTSGASSIIMFASPKAGGNIKAMAEGVMSKVNEAMTIIPKDIQFKILVDPSEFIRSSIENVFHEVFIGSCLAVLVLLLFIGSPRNVATAAIEIPISLVLAFILMRVANMNINLISLGGLALSAGMNVDASVVVMENIFRHFEHHHGRISFEEKLQIVIMAVKEVRAPVIASTIASLVVFIPLAFTSNLSYAILGDLAKAVVFSHAFSAVVALILVPTVRLHIMSREKTIQHPKSPIENWLKSTEQFYGNALHWFILRPKVKIGSIIVLIGLLVGLILGVLPQLPKEVVGKPDTDWIVLGANNQTFSKTKQMEALLDEAERDVMAKWRGKFSYTFYQVWNPTGGEIMFRLRNKADMSEILQKIKEQFKNTPTINYWSEVWNPSELPLPELPQFQLAITGGDAKSRRDATQELYDLFLQKDIFENLSANPNTPRDDIFEIKPKIDQWTLAYAAGARISLDDLLEQFRTISSQRYVDTYPFGAETHPVKIAVGGTPPKSLDDVGSWSVAIGPKIVPFRALVDIVKTPKPPVIKRVNDQEINYIYGYVPEHLKSQTAAKAISAKNLVASWQKDYSEKNKNNPLNPTVKIEDGELEVHDAIDQLQMAIGWSILLIFLTMLIQFGSFMEPLIVLAAIPLGVIGVLVSLFVFRSSLSLNSALGVILLNGIAVANSIILVDFTKKLVDRGALPLDAALQAARARLRPIFITSLTTVLGMLPIACGFGEGGKVLQPLGIAVAGGLWVSMLLTLFIVPALHVSYLQMFARKTTAHE